jgi:hypothetical protein
MRRKSGARIQYSIAQMLYALTLVVVRARRP